jgi:hypothetical protein
MNVLLGLLRFAFLGLLLLFLVYIVLLIRRDME